MAGSGVWCNAPFSGWVRHLVLSLLSSQHPCVCVCCHSIVGLGSCVVLGLRHCGMAVVVYVWVGMAVGWGGVMGVWFLLLVFSFLFLLWCVVLLFCLLLFCSPLFFVSRFSSAVEWRWKIYHVSECSVGMTAMGSLSRSFSFFW